MNRSDWILLLTLSLLWGGSFLFVEVGLGGLPPLTVVWGRVAGAALILGLALRLSGHRLPRRAWPAILVMGLLNNVVPFTLFALAQGRIGGGLAAIANATTPLWTMVVAHLFTPDERITPAKAAGLGLGVAGVAFMARGGSEGEGLAILACLAAALSYGLAGVWGRRFRAMGVAPMATAFGQVAASTLILTPLWLGLEAMRLPPAPGVAPVLAVVALASLSTALAYLIYFRLLVSAGATNLSLVTFLIPVSAVALGVLLLNETLQARHLVGFVLIAMGLLAVDGRVLQWARSTRGAR